MTADTDAPLLTPRWTPLRPHAPQSRLWRCKKRFVCVVAGRGSGKTEEAKRKLVVSLADAPKPWPDPRYFFGGPTRDQARRIAWQDLLDLIPDEWIEGGKNGSNVRWSDLEIHTIFGSTLKVIGLKEAARSEGVQYDGGVIDESSDVAPGAFRLSILPALTWRRGWCWRIGVPKRRGLGAAEFKTAYMKGLDGTDPDCASFWWPSRDIVPAQALAEAQRNLDAKDFREQFEASWESAGGQVFHAFDKNENVRPCEYHSDKPLYVGCDFNVDPMAWTIGHAYDNRMEWIDELWLRDTNTVDTLGVLARRYANHRGGFTFMGDATGRARKTSAATSDYLQIANDNRIGIMGRKIRFPKANPSIDDRLSACNAMFCNAAGERRMYVAPTCVHLIHDIESRGYKEGSRDLADSGDLGHITDAMGYVVHQLFPIRLALDGKAGVVARKGSPAWQYQ